MTTDASLPPDGSQTLERSVSQHSAASARSHRSARHASRNRKLLSQPSSSASSIAPSDKSLTSFPSFSPDSPTGDRLQEDPQTSLKTPSARLSETRRASSTLSLVDSLAGRSPARDALFEDTPLRQSIPGALHNAPDDHIERLIARHGTIALVRQIAEDLAQRDVQIASLRRKADERERALRRIARECGLSNLDLETRLHTVEAELRANDRAQLSDNDALSDRMSDAMRDTVAENAFRETHHAVSNIRASSASLTANVSPVTSKSTIRAWKDYFWGGGIAKHGLTSGINAGARQTMTSASTVVRSSPSMDRRPTLQEDFFNPPTRADPKSMTSPSRTSSINTTNVSEPKPAASLASLAQRLVAGGTNAPRDADVRGRATSPSGRALFAWAGSAVSARTVQSARAASIARDPKALMAMRRITPAPQTPVLTKPLVQDTWGAGRAPASSQENHGPLEMDAILPPDSQPPTMTSINVNYTTNGLLTDRFGFIYDQHRKKRQKEAAHMAQHIRNGSRPEMLINGRATTSSSFTEETPSSEGSASDDGQPGSLASAEERGVGDGKPKRWQDYLRIAKFPTELLSNTPSMSVRALEVMEGTEMPPVESREGEPLKSPGITSTCVVLVPLAITTTAVDSEVAAQPPEADGATSGMLVKKDAEAVRLLLEQLSDVHDTLQRDKTVRWNDFFRKVRAERRREGEAAVAAAAAAAAEARFETPVMILPETRVADGEMIGISDLGNKGKVGRAKWNEFKALVLGGIPVAYRAKIWSECSGANALRIPGYYDDLVSRSDACDDREVVGQIQMDIHRTLTDNIFFRKGPGVQRLNEVLLAYSRRNTKVGYCQGMNLIAANLLLIAPSAEDAFWVLASMIESILPEGYYDQSLMTSRADQQVLRQYVSAVLPRLSAHLDSMSIELEALTFQWFLSVFTDCLCAEALFRVWDVVLCTNDGSTFLFQVALALLKLNEKNLLERGSPAGIYTYINHQMTEHAISIDGLIQASEGLGRVIRREDVEQRRNKAMQAERHLVAERHSDGIQKAKVASGSHASTGYDEGSAGDKGLKQA